MDPNENITMAAQLAELLASDLRSAHKDACRSDSALATVLRDIMRDFAEIHNRIDEIEARVCPIE